MYLFIRSLDYSKSYERVLIIPLVPCVPKNGTPNLIAFIKISRALVGTNFFAKMGLLI